MISNEAADPLRTAFLYLLLITVMGMILPSCNTTKYLEGDETLLRKNKITIKDSKVLRENPYIMSELEDLLVQKPNGTFFGVPRSFYYFRNSGPDDTLSCNKFFREQLGEVPAIYDSLSTQASVGKLRNYFVNRKGYYDAQVSYEDTQLGDFTLVEYTVEPAQRYTVSSIDFIGKDTATIEKLRGIIKEGNLKVGSPVDESLFNEEMTRLVTVMQNQGYASFAANHIHLLGDSSDVDKTVDVFFEINPPLPDSLHRLFHLGKIQVYTDYHRNQSEKNLSSLSYNGIDFYRESKDFLVEPQILEPMLYVNDTRHFSRQLRDKTFRKLSRLGSYRFVTIDPVVREGTSDTLDYKIYLSPFETRWVADYGTDAFYATLNQSQDSRNQLVGLSVNSLFKNRNLLGGDEQFSIGAEAGVELQLSSPLLVRTLTFGIDNALRFPRQVDLLGFSNLMRLFDFGDRNTYRLFKEETETTIGAGFSHINIQDFYSISTLRANYSYAFQPQSNTKFIIRQVGLDLNIYDIKGQFKDELENNPLLANSFQNTLLTGYLFRDISYFHTTPQDIKGRSRAYILNFEASGWETYLANQLYNVISGSDIQWKFTDKVDFAKYIRLDGDIRFNRHFRKGRSLAARVYAGGIVPFGKILRVPYIRQFSVGGPNSLRAWNQREIGPGSYDSRPDNIENPNVPFYQQGDLRLEMNVEFRFDVLWYLEGAFFADAGNVWNFREDEQRPGAKISSRFYEDLAIGVGYGLRFDFDYFLIRFDFGYKIKYPYKLKTDSYFTSWKGFKNQGLGNFQVAVNYPF